LLTNHERQKPDFLMDLSHRTGVRGGKAWGVGVSNGGLTPAADAATPPWGIRLKVAD